MRKYVWTKSDIRKSLIILSITGVLGSVMLSFGIELTSWAQTLPARKLNVLHIMSYHADWLWNRDQFDGFKYALNGIDIEYKIFEMDAKRYSSQEWLEQAGQKARNLIDSWKPDLIYANDDDAQEYITKYYVNTEIPIVFSGVNANPEIYGFSGSTNVTGVVEHEHFVASVRLLQEIKPDIKRLL